MELVYLLGILALISIFIEFYLPGGVFAILGVALGLIGMFVAFSINLEAGIGYLAVESVLIMVTIQVALFLIKRQNICLTDPEREEPREMGLKGKVGNVTKDLRPSGFIEVEGREIQALSQGAYIKKGTKIEVIREEGNHVIVR